MWLRVEPTPVAEDDGGVGHGLGGEAATLVMREEEDVVAARQALGGVPVGQCAAHTLHRGVRLVGRAGRVCRVGRVGRVGEAGEQESRVSRVGAVGRCSREV